MEDSRKLEEEEHLEKPERRDIAAAEATNDEHNLTLREAFKYYSPGVFWAVAMAFTMYVTGSVHPKLKLILEYI